MQIKDLNTIRKDWKIIGILNWTSLYFGLENKLILIISKRVYILEIYP